MQDEEPASLNFVKDVDKGGVNLSLSAIAAHGPGQKEGGDQSTRASSTSHLSTGTHGGTPFVLNSTDDTGEMPNDVLTAEKSFEKFKNAPQH